MLHLFRSAVPGLGGFVFGEVGLSEDQRVLPQISLDLSAQGVVHAETYRER